MGSWGAHGVAWSPGACHLGGEAKVTVSKTAARGQTPAPGSVPRGGCGQERGEEKADQRSGEGPREAVGEEPALQRGAQDHWPEQGPRGHCVS